MACEATPARGGAIAAVRDSEAFRAAWRVAVSTRAAVLLVAVFAALSFGPATGGLARENADKFDDPSLTHVLADPGARAARALGLGLVPADRRLRLRRQRAAGGVLPAVPAAGAGVATPLGGSEAALLVAAYALSLAAFLAALFLLHRLTELELGGGWPADAAAAGRLPRGVYFGAPYSESLFLLLAVGAFYAARTGTGPGRARARTGVGHAQRGLLLLIPLAMLWWGSRPRRPRDAAWLALAPLGIAAYAAWLGLVEGDALRFLDVQEAWSRQLAVPLTGAWDGLVAAVDGVRQLASGSRTPVYFEAAAGDPFGSRDQRDAVRDAGVRRGRLRGRLAPPAARVRGLGGDVAAAAADLPRHAAAADVPAALRGVLFPLFMWLAIVCDERRITDLVAAGSPSASACSRRSTRAGTGSRERGRQSGAARRARHPRRAPAAGAAPPAAAAQSGFEVSEERAAAGFAAEIAYYLDHHLEGQTASGSSACATAAPRRCGGRSSSPTSTTRPRAGRCWRRSSSGPIRTCCPRSASCASAA